MGHNRVMSGYSKSTGIPQVDGLSTGPPGFGMSHHHKMGMAIWITSQGT